MCNKTKITIFNILSLIFLLLCAIVTGNGCTAKTPSKNITLIAVTAHNCESCTAAEDNIYFVTRHYPEIQIKAVDIHNPEGAMYVSTYHLWRVPVYLFIDNNGKELYRLEGEQTRTQIQEAIEVAKTRIKTVP